MSERCMEAAVSLAGHDKGGVFAVISRSDDGFAMIADGRRRKIEKPKKKKLRHLKTIGEISFPMSEEVTNRRLREELRSFCGPKGAGGGM